MEVVVLVKERYYTKRFIVTCHLVHPSHQIIQTLVDTDQMQPTVLADSGHLNGSLIK